MIHADDSDGRASSLASTALRLLAVDPVHLGGAVLRGGPTPARDEWLATLHAILPVGAPWRRMPTGIADERLLGGLDLAATLAAGRPIAESGLLAQSTGGVLVVPSAECLAAGAAAHLAAALDAGEIRIERDGLGARQLAAFAAVLLDEGGGGADGERAPAALAERVAFHLDLSGVRHVPPAPTDGSIAAAAARVRTVDVPERIVEALCAAGIAFGVPSLRVASLALRAAKAAAALAQRDTVTAEDAELAAALVLAPRTTRLPARDDETEPAGPEQDALPPTEMPPPPEALQDGAGEDRPDCGSLADSIADATLAAIPIGLLAELSLAAEHPRSAAPGGKGAVPLLAGRRGRPAGTRRGVPGNGVRLAVVDTLRAAAPWQRLRRRAADEARDEGGAHQARSRHGRVLVRREDFRVGRFKETAESVTIFVVDASGSAALHRLAEVKGAVELILAECYVRRDQVALIAFRGSGADLVLPPTRSLARAKRVLAGQAGGGGTPLAAALTAAELLADTIRRKGQRPQVVLMTDGRANINRAGRPGRAEAEVDAMAAAQQFRLGGASAILLDTAPRPAEPARRLAAAMGARYIPLPYADAQAVSRAVLAIDATAAHRNR